MYISCCVDICLLVIFVQMFVVIACGCLARIIHTNVSVYYPWCLVLYVLEGSVTRHC